jgi:hypothetical protein
MARKRRTKSRPQPALQHVDRGWFGLTVVLILIPGDGLD